MIPKIITMKKPLSEIFIRKNALFFLNEVFFLQIYLHNSDLFINLPVQILISILKIIHYEQNRTH